MNPLKAWNAELEAAGFFCHLKTYTCGHTPKNKKLEIEGQFNRNYVVE
jgi:hypothetical protein